MRIKLTKQSVANIEHPEKAQKFIWDILLPGFGLRVTPNTKNFIVQAKLPDGNKRRVTLGKPEHHPDIQKLRNKARELIVKIQGGYDPTAEKNDKQKNITLREVMKDYLNNRDLKPRTIEDFHYHMDRMFKKWADRPIREINKQKVEKLFDEQTEIGKTQANQGFRLLRALINYAKVAYYDAQDRALFVENPVDILSAKGRWNASKAKTDRIPINKVGEVWNMLCEHAGQTTYDCVSFILLTGSRRSEAQELEWRNVDFENRLWTIENPKNGISRTLPLNRQAVELLEHRKELAINDYVFPGKATGHIRELKRVADKISDVSGVKVTIHGLRRTFTSITDELKIDLITTKLLLNHVLGGDVTFKHYKETMILDKLKPEIDSIGNWIEKQGRLAENKVVDISTAGKAL